MLTRLLALAAGAACRVRVRTVRMGAGHDRGARPAVRAVGGRADRARRRGARIRVRVRPVRRRRVVGVRRARDVRRHAGAGRRGRDGRLRRVPRAVARARRLGRRALHAAAVGRAPASRRPLRGRSPSGCAGSCSRASRGCRWATPSSCPSGALPLGGYAPVGGVFLVSLAVALCAAGAAGIVAALAAAQPRRVVGCLAGITRDRGRRRGADPHHVDHASRRARRDLADAGQRLAGAEVRSGVPPAQLRALRHARHAEPRPHRRAAGERVSAVRRRDSRQRVPAPGRASAARAAAPSSSASSPPSRRRRPAKTSASTTAS